MDTRYKLTGIRLKIEDYEAIEAERKEKNDREHLNIKFGSFLVMVFRQWQEWKQIKG